MKTEDPAPITIPFEQRWRDVRLRILPVVAFGATCCAIIFLWKDDVVGRAMIGQAEPVLSNVSSYKPGVLAELSVARFQRVKSGDPIGKVLVTDPRILASSLAVIQAEIDSLRANMKPIMAQQHNAMDYDQLRLDWMKERAQLASARVNLELAETEFHRMEELFKDQIIAQRVYDQAKATRNRLQNEVENLATLVDEVESNIRALQLTNSTELSKVSLDPLQAALAVQESKLRLTEAELSPITLRAPIDGVVSTIYHRAGEAVTAGQPVVAVATLSPVRIVGYLRPPIVEEPKAGMSVEVRTRGPHREIGRSKIIEVGTQLEALPAALAGPVKVAYAELGLPVDISLPSNMRIHAGELVDIILISKPE
jgi:multidrug resistance efflux pump